MSRVTYAAAYFWTCPDCGLRWEMRHRPRAGAQLVCKLGPEQKFGQPFISNAPCGTVHTSAGRRKGLPDT